MRRAQVIGLAVAFGAGTLAFVGMRGLLGTTPESAAKHAEIETTQVLVAQMKIPLGQLVHEGHFKWQDWPKDGVGRSFITKSSRPNAIRDYAGAISRAPILAGEPIADGKLIKPGSGGVLAAILPSGMRAISTRISEHTAAGKLILPNDRVDVILIRRVRAPSTDSHLSEVLFRNARVLAIGQQIDSRESKKGSAGNVATLELTPQQAERLALANAMGEITLALRSIADVAEASVDYGIPANPDSKDRDTISILRYGMRSRARFVN